MPCYIVIAEHAWGRGEDVLAAKDACAQTCGRRTLAREHFVYECPGDDRCYSVSPIDGSLQWDAGAPEPVLVLHHVKGKRPDRRRLTIAQLREMARG